MAPCFFELQHKRDQILNSQIVLKKYRNSYRQQEGHWFQESPEIEFQK